MNEQNTFENVPRIVQFGEVLNWFRRFYDGEWGERIFEKTADFYRWACNIAGDEEAADVQLYAPGAGSVFNNEGNYENEALYHLYHFMNDNADKAIVLCLINPDDIIEGLQDETARRARRL